MQVLVPDHVKAELQPQLRAISDSVQVVGMSVDGQVEQDPSQAEVLLRFFPNDQYPGKVFDANTLRRVLAQAPQIRWIHNGMTGMNAVLYPELIESEIVVTNGAGAHRDALAETVLGYMLAVAKQLPGHLANQQQRRWQHLPHRLLQGSSVLIIGLGRVGEAIARRCKALGMSVTGIKRTPATKEIPGVDRVETLGALHRLLPEAEYVVLSAALTKETRGIIGAAELRAMRRDGYLINIARGELIDQQALVKALQENWIAGACLDVFEEEPLPESSPLWQLPNVIVTPHNAAWSPRVKEEALAIFLENFQRYVRGEALRNVVDKHAGY